MNYFISQKRKFLNTNLSPLWGYIASEKKASMVENRFVMQFQSDLLGIPVQVPCEKETAAFGSACLAGYTMGALPSLECVKDFVRLKDDYQPLMVNDERDVRLDRWLQAVERCRGWVK